ncbi:MAG: hypothetical protein ACREJB_12885 [Planctomycetaceae bacterium]
MTIEFHCPHCNKLLKTADDKAGRKANCPGCSQSITVPSGAQEEQWSAGQEDDGFGEQYAAPDPWDAQFGSGPGGGGYPPYPGGAPQYGGYGTTPAGYAPPADRTCPMCGESVPATALNCPSCGERLTPPPGSFPPPVYPPPYSGYPPPPGGYRKPHRGGMILTFGILSIVLGLCCALASFGFGIPAWTMGHADRQEMAHGRMDPEGQGMTTAGMVCGIVGVVIGALGIVLNIAMLAAG